jgi:hypothetical protein
MWGSLDFVCCIIFTDLSIPTTLHPALDIVLIRSPVPRPISRICLPFYPTNPSLYIETKRWLLSYRLASQLSLRLIILIVPTPFLVKKE